MKNDINYTLLEIIEGPKRINNVPQTKLFDYLLESITTEDERFESFMRGLELNAWWAYYGFALMCSDMLPLKQMFKPELKEETIIHSEQGSMTEITVFNMLMNYFSRGYFREKKYVNSFSKYIEQNLGNEQYKFCVMCLTQKYKKEILPYFAKLYKLGKLNPKVHELFSFCLKDSFKTSNVITPYCICVEKEFFEVKKIGNCLYHTEQLLDNDTTHTILSHIQNIVNTWRRNGALMHYEIPNICYIICDFKYEPIVFVSSQNNFVCKSPLHISDIDFMSMIYEKKYNMVFINVDNTIQSIFSVDNKNIKVYSLPCSKCKSLEKGFIVLPVSGKMIYTYKFVSENTEHIVFSSVNVDESMFKDNINIVKINDIQYLTN